MGIENVTGKLTLLRVHDRGTKYGPANDRIDVEAIVQFASRPAEAFGFQLRDDANLPAREGMLGLLRDGFNNGWTVGIDYQRDSASGKRNGTVIRVWLKKPAGSVPVSGAGDPGIAFAADREELEE